jgi:[ribosomal protein S5]-alanine N-acetyltransferase
MGDKSMKIIDSERLLLRKWSENDYQDLFEYASDPQVGDNAGNSTIETIDQAIKIISNYIKADRSYAIFLKDESKVIGSIGMDDMTPEESTRQGKQCYIGFTINPKYWGNGYATEAVRCFTKSLFAEYDLDLIWSSHYFFNERSKRVLEKCGFEYRFTRESSVKAFGKRIVSELFYTLDTQ